MSNETTTAGQPGDRMHVLVVNDDASGSRWLDEKLQLLGFKAVLAWDCETALTLHELEHDRLVAVVLNMDMQGQQGPAVLKAILEADRRTRIIAFGVGQTFDPRGTLVVLPAPLELKSLDIALQVVRAMKPRRVAASVRHNAVRSAA